HLAPVADTGALSYSNPGDIRVGPDRLLYLLNNGPDTQALYVMQPDGHVVRQLARQDKYQVAVGLQLGPGGDLYISDMVGGRIRRYGQNGGKELSEWAGEGGGFNNVAGI